ncbi:MAG: type II toxin-antitoxin system HicB family antitoxin [Magnetococcales bacterium]|nr:type II toxin-antitoxin system HicB family antitoxin [Magnetococcales bacterium]
MSQTYTAVTKQVDGWWVGWVAEIPGVNCQEPTRETLLETLAITLREAIAFNRQEALAMVGSDYHEECIAL